MKSLVFGYIYIYLFNYFFQYLRKKKEISSFWRTTFIMDYEIGSMQHHTSESLILMMYFVTKPIREDVTMTRIEY
jgi:hypothetical protein